VYGLIFVSALLMYAAAFFAAKVQRPGGEFGPMRGPAADAAAAALLPLLPLSLLPLLPLLCLPLGWRGFGVLCGIGAAPGG
jgi:hypothetical protein